MNDTPPDVAAEVRRRIMARSGSERFLMGIAMFDAARRMVLASLPKDLPPAELARLLYARMYGMELPDDFGI